MKSTVSLTGGTQVLFNFRGPSFKTPLSSQNNGGTIRIEFGENNRNQRTYDLTGGYPTLIASTSATTATGTCASFAGTTVGTSGNVDCTITVPMNAGSATTAITVDFPNANGAEYSQVYPYCDAYIASGTATILKGQLSCSRKDPSSTEARFFITGFKYAAGSTITFTFRARALASTSITMKASYQGVDTNGNYYDISQLNSASVSIASVAATTCKFKFYTLS